MIDKKELRFGNYVCERGNHRIYNVIEILRQGVAVKYWSCGETEGISFNKLVPIPLSQDILIKIGARIEEKGFEIHDLIFDKEKDGYQLFGSEWTIGNSFLYLHNLQNIVYDLTGKEIEYKS